MADNAQVETVGGSEPRHRFMTRDIDEELVWSLHCAQPSLERIRQLAAAGADVNAGDDELRSVLMHAVSDRHVPKEFVRFLVESGADATAVDKAGNTVLMEALWNPRLEPEVIKLLLARGVDINAANDAGETALMRAVRNSWPQEKIVEIIWLLVESGADVNAADSLEDTVIVRALGNVPKLPRAAIEYLISSGAVVDYTDRELLASAVMDCQPEAISFLLDNGANPNLILDESETVLDWVEDFTRFLLQDEPEDEFGEKRRQEHINRLSAIYKLLVRAGAKRAKELIDPEA